MTSQMAVIRPIFLIIFKNNIQKLILKQMNKHAMRISLSLSHTQTHQTDSFTGSQTVTCSYVAADCIKVCNFAII